MNYGSGIGLTKKQRAHWVRHAEAKCLVDIISRRDALRTEFR
jgi:hypothetical protein